MTTMCYDTRTVSYYTREASSYVKKTQSYALFPGLESSIIEFVTRVCERGLVLDCGSGCGRDAAMFGRHGRRVVMVDLALPLLRAGKSYTRSVLEESSREDVSAIQAEFTHLPLLDCSVDGLWSCASFLHLEREALPLAFAEAVRVLKPGSPFAISMRHGSQSYRDEKGRLFTLVSFKEFAQLCCNAGLALERIDGPVRRGWLVAWGVREG